MIQIALETTGKNGSLAILDSQTVLWQHGFGVQRRTAADLAPHLDDCLKWCDDNSHKIQGISVAVGPGSFTGLRIGVTTAKSLAYALQLPIIPVGSLSAIAAVVEIDDETENVLIGLNAYRQQVFAAEFTRRELDGMEPNTSKDVFSEGTSSWNHRVEMIQRDAWDQRVRSRIKDKTWTVSGDQSIFSEQDAPFAAIRPNVDAVGVGRVAARLIAENVADPDRADELTTDQNGIFEDAFSLAASYLKPSAAEEKAASR